jgi:hypothetical protein
MVLIYHFSCVKDWEAYFHISLDSNILIVGIHYVGIGEQLG